MCLVGGVSPQYRNWILELTCGVRQENAPAVNRGFNRGVNFRNDVSRDFVFPFFRREKLIDVVGDLFQDFDLDGLGDFVQEGV